MKESEDEHVDRQNVESNRMENDSRRRDITATILYVMFCIIAIAATAVCLLTCVFEK
jgi:type IV secretory pathway component VirB8